MLIIYETEYENFGSLKDMLRYMREEKIESFHVTVKICGQTVGAPDFRATVEGVEKWIAMGRES